jgi:hypothetical protein
MTNIVAIFAWLGGAFFCGILPLGFAAILFFSARKRGQTGSAVGAARKLTLAALRTGAGLTRLQGKIAPQTDALDGAPENALVYLRMKVEIYINDSDESGWRGMTDKGRGIPFQLEDGTGEAWVVPDGLDKHMLGIGFVPNEDQIQAACILLNISTGNLHGKLRYWMWELRSGQNVTVVGSVVQGQHGLEVRKTQEQPFIVSPMLGQEVDANFASQASKSRTWTYILGIPGAIMLLCTLSGALISLVRALTTK